METTCLNCGRHELTPLEHYYFTQCGGNGTPYKWNFQCAVLSVKLVDILYP